MFGRLDPANPGRVLSGVETENGSPAYSRMEGPGPRRATVDLTVDQIIPTSPPR